MTWVTSLMNVAGSPSPAGLLMLPYPQKPKIHPNFKDFQFRLIISIVYHKKPLRLHTWNLHV